MTALALILASIVAPTLIQKTDPVYPDALREAGVYQASLEVMLTVDVGGRVSEMELVSADDPACFDALRAVIHDWRFTPALQEGEVVPARFALKWRFETVPPAAEAPRQGRLVGRLMRRGVRRPLVGLPIRFEPGGHSTHSDETGRFSIDLPPGDLRVTIEDATVEPFRETITIAPDERADVEWRLTPIVGAGADIVVVGRTPKEIQRTTLDTYELTHVPGTMGDPLRVLQSLPGVGTLFSLLPYPVVRGAPPGDTAYQIDGTPVPLLFHLGIGTSVVHPRLIERVDFYPGAAPIRYGRYIGGAVDGITRRPDEDQWLADIDVNLFQAGGLVSVPSDDGDTQLTVGGRYSYTGALLSVFAPDTVLDFWDYQARFDQKTPGGGRLRLSAFGALDDFGSESRSNRTFTTFHRIAGRHIQPLDDDDTLIASLDLGLDRLDVPDDSGDSGAQDARVKLDEYLIRPRLDWVHTFSERVEWTTGADVDIRPSDDSGANFDQAGTEAFTSNAAQTRIVAGAYTTLDWKLTDTVSLLPGLRGDVYFRRGGETLTVDPRIGLRWALSADTTLKAQVGISHAPQRFFIPVPGLGEIEVDADLIRAFQVAVGVEQRLSERWSLDATVYGTLLENLIGFDIGGNQETGGDEDAISSIDEFTFDAQGRSAGLEVMLRRHRAGRFFGWIAYTLQRAERQRADGQWVLSTLDQTHIFNAVVSWQFAKLWSFGVRLHHHTGHPRSLNNEARLPAFTQIDLRLDTVWIHDDWQIELYIDVINAGFAEEVAAIDEDGERESLQYILPTLGVHATF